MRDLILVKLTAGFVSTGNVRSVKTEIEKEFKHGFVLTEDELRRLVDCVSQAMKRALANGAFTTRFHAKLRNGTVAECDGVEDLLGFDNSGANQITRLHIHLKEEKPEGRHQIATDFNNERENRGFDAPIEVRVRGNDRDWVHITSSQIEERIAKVRALGPGRLFSRFGISLILPLCTLIFMIGSVIGLTLSKPGESTAASALETAIREKAVSDPIQAILLVEKVKKTEYSAGSYRAIKDGLIIPVLVVIAFVLILYSLQYLYPSYVFYWADAIKVYDRRLAARRYVLIVLITGFFVSVVGSLVATKINPWH